MENIKNKIFDMLEFSTDINISYQDFDGVKVSFDGEKAVIGYNSKSNLARGYFLLAMNLSKGNKPFEICQKRHFKTLGVSLDVSRGGAPTVEAIKSFIVKSASLGYNMMFLYMEDMFEMEKYPRFGYMRGRYTHEELKMIDDFAYEFGIEVVPAIQTLGHMEQYLQWQEADPIRNVGNILLADNEKTYEFIEDMIKTCRSIFRTDKIKTNLDEAQTLHLGKYMKLHGLQNSTEVFLRHMNRVVSICQKYGFKPRMPLDVLFRLSSKTGNYYDLEVEFPQAVKDMIPKDVTSIAWTYGVPRQIDMKKRGIDEEGYYRIFLNKHKELCPNFIFQTAIWCWEGYFEDTQYTVDITIPSMINAIKQNITEVIVATFGDQGAETNIIKQIPGTLPIYSEYCFRGLDCTMDDICEVSTYLEKMPYQNKIELMKRIHGGFWDCQKFNKCLIYGDILYNLIDHKYDYEKVSTMYKEGAELCRKYLAEDTRNAEYYNFVLHSFEIGILKLDMFENLRKKYRENDMDYLKKAAYEYIPAIIEHTKAFYKIFQKNWDETNKPFGGENAQIRLGGVINRAEYVAERMAKYINGEIPALEEFEQEVIKSERVTYNHGFRKNTTTNVAGIA